VPDRAPATASGCGGAASRCMQPPSNLAAARCSRPPAGNRPVRFIPAGQQVATTGGWLRRRFRSGPAVATGGRGREGAWGPPPLEWRYGSGEALAGACCAVRTPCRTVHTSRHRMEMSTGAEDHRRREDLPRGAIDSPGKEAATTTRRLGFSRWHGLALPARRRLRRDEVTSTGKGFRWQPNQLPGRSIVYRYQSTCPAMRPPVACCQLQPSNNRPGARGAWGMRKSHVAIIHPTHARLGRKKQRRDLHAAALVRVCIYHTCSPTAVNVAD